MFDFHSHIIHGVDDGSQSLEESLSILRSASKAGIKKMVATPHYIKGSMDEDVSVLHDKLDILRQALHDNNIDIEVFLGNEIYVDIDMTDYLTNGECSSINKSRYVLIELPFSCEINQLEDIIFELKLKEYIPVLAHPERYEFVHNDLGKLTKLIELGVLVQLNLGSLSGMYGKSIKKTAQLLVDQQMVHFIGTDVHRAKSRALDIEPSLQYLKGKWPEKMFDAVVFNNAEAVVNGGIVMRHEMKTIKKKRKWVKRTLIALAVLMVVGASGVYYAYKKVESQFEAAMIQQAQSFVAAEAAAEKAKVEQAEKEKLERENKREQDRLEREAMQKAEDEKIAKDKKLLEDKLKAEEAAALLALEEAKNEEEKEAAERDAEAARMKLEAETERAKKEADKLEAERLAEDEKIKEEERLEEVKIEADRLEAVKLADKEAAEKEAALEENYSDYETDKAKALDLALSKLTVDQVSRLIQLASGGFEPEEKQEAKEMFYNNFTEEEQIWILDMYIKYYG